MKPRARLTYTGNTQGVAAGGNILFNGITADDGINYLPDGGIQITVPGTYDFGVSVTTIATAAGTQAVQLYEGAVGQAGALAMDDADAIGDYGNMAFSTFVTVREGAGDQWATVYIKAPNATSVPNAIVKVERCER